MTNSVLDIRRLAPVDWRMLRDTRLLALRDSPDAFTSPLPVERGWTEPEWRQLFDTATWVVAIERDVVIGLAGLTEGRPPERRHIESIWVAPAHRRRGVSRSILHTIVEIARTKGVTDLMLWVLEDNTAALRAYARLGFVPTGERQLIDMRRRRFERRLRLAI